MPTPILKKMPPIEGVVPGEKATLDLPIGPMYHKLQLRGTVKPNAGDTADITDIFGLIKIAVNGKTQREATAEEIRDAINNLNGAEFNVETVNETDADPTAAPAADDTITFILTILFAEPFRKSYLAQKIMAWPTRWPNGETLGTFQVEINVPDTAGATLHSIVAYASITNELGKVDANGNAIFNISKWWRTNVIYGAAGERYLVNLPKRDAYQALHFFTQAGDPISHIKIKRDGEEILDVDKDVNDRDLAENGLNADAISDDRLDVVFDREDLPDTALPLTGVREFEVIPTLAAAAAANKSITLITEVYGPRD